MTGKLADAARGRRHVFLHDILLDARIGVHPHEHGRAQRVRINLDLAVADEGAQSTLPPAAGRDELARVVDYEALAATVRRIVSAGHVKLVETLAETLAAACLADPRVFTVRVRVEKLDVFDDIGAAGVEVERCRG